MYDLDRAKALRFICENAPSCSGCIIGTTVCNKLVGADMPSELTEDDLLRIVFTEEVEVMTNEDKE